MSKTPPPPPPTRLMLITPPLAEAGDWPQLLADLAKAGDVAALLLRLVPAAERDQINLIKAIAAPLQELGVAVVADTDPSVAVRGGADGVHVSAGAEAIAAAREALKGERIVGAGTLRARHDAMDAGDAGCDYVLFGEPRPDGSTPPLAAVVERAQWWAEIFEIPCAAYASDIEGIDPLLATGCEFLALGDWLIGQDDAATQIAGIAARARARQPVHG